MKYYKNDVINAKFVQVVQGRKGLPWRLELIRARAERSCGTKTVAPFERIGAFPAGQRAPAVI